jgi:hypothetical protein
MVDQLAGIGARVFGKRDDGDELLAPPLAGTSGDDNVCHRGRVRSS